MKSIIKSTMCGLTAKQILELKAENKELKKQLENKFLIDDGVVDDLVLRDQIAILSHEWINDNIVIPKVIFLTGPQSYQIKHYLNIS